MSINLEILIRDNAATMAEQMKEVARWAHSEEDVRHECNKLIDDFIKKAGLRIKGRHEYGLAGGRIDSKYGGVIIEYKNPKGSQKLLEDPSSPGVKAVVEQIRKRFQDFETFDGIKKERLFAVGCDGDTLVFVRHRGRDFEIEDPQEVTSHNVERILRAIVSLGARGYSFTPENLTEHFGVNGTIAQKGIHSIYEVICKTNSVKAHVFFNQWRIFFGEVCGYDVSGQNVKISKLGEHYTINDVQAAEILFAVHTYYAVFIKLLAAEIVSSFSPLGTSTLKRLIAAPTSMKLRSELELLEHGGIWSQLGIRNFLEGDLFSWYLDAWDENCYETIHDMVVTLDQYDPTTLSVEPSESRDLLKRLYQHLFPKSIRHDLGEYYTPDWLAELVLNELGYDGNPDRRVLDPACGSGTFLVMAINRIKVWFQEHRHECCFGEEELLQKILNNVIGFDLNPLAVMAARTNYLLAIRDLLRFGSNIEIPVYLCDSLMTPSEYGDLFTRAIGNTHKLQTSAGDFLIPLEVTTSRELIGRYADTLEFCIRNEYGFEDFISQCESEKIPVSEKELHKSLYNQLAELDNTKQNGIWARIIKNAFAPLFIATVDYVVGNPPWVNWENLPQTYRQSTAQLWQDYEIFPHKGYQAKLGAGKDDISILMTYVAHDRYLIKGGRLGFVITQSVFKTKGGGKGFRTFKYKNTNTGQWFMHPLIVHDFTDFQPFEGATNRTAVFIAAKETKPFKYPIPYVLWEKAEPGDIGQELSLLEVKAMTSRRKLKAQPVTEGEATSPWLTAPKGTLSGMQKVIGQSDYQAHEGVNTGGLSGCFWIRILDKLSDGNLLIENLYDEGKIRVKRLQTVIEPDLVYPLLRGKDVSRWKAVPSSYIILANLTDRLAGIPEIKMKRNYPKTYSYLKNFEGDIDKPERGSLRGRSGYRQYFKDTDPFYSMYNVGPYTFYEWKVVWNRIDTRLRASVVSTNQAGKVIIPQDTHTLVPCISQKEAHYFCALFNSSPSDLTVRSFSISKGFASAHVLNTLSIPKYDSNSSKHAKLADLSVKCHNAAKIDDQKSIRSFEGEIDKLSAEIWSIDSDELRGIQRALET